MRVEIHASLNKFLMSCDFLNSEKKWNTVQLSSSCLCHCLIFTDFIQLSIIPFFTSLAEKNINHCLCVGKVKFLLPIRRCIFLMRAVVMICVRQKKFCVCKLCGHRAVGLSHDFLDIYQFLHRISNKIVASAVSQEWWDLFSMTNYYQLCWEENITTQYAVKPHERSTPPQDILSQLLKLITLIRDLLTAVSAKTGTRTIWVRHWLTTKSMKHIESTAFHMSSKGTQCPCQSATIKIMKKICSELWPS